MRSRGFSSVRVAIIAGTLHPKPTIMGTNALPGSPKKRIKRSITKAARAIYPESSSIERNKNKNPTIGMKVATTCIPLPTPCVSTTFSQLGQSTAFSQAPKPSMRNAPTTCSKKSTKALPMLIVNKNMTYITSKKIGMPKKRFSTMRSIFSLVWRLTSLSLQTTCLTS